jgi:hypothetical protein
MYSPVGIWGYTPTPTYEVKIILIFETRKINSTINHLEELPKMRVIL